MPFYHSEIKNQLKHYQSMYFKKCSQVAVKSSVVFLEISPSYSEYGILVTNNCPINRYFLPRRDLWPNRPD